MSLSRRLTANALSNALVIVVDLVLMFFLLRFILARMTMEAYGVWELTGALFAYTLLLQGGMNSAVNFRIPRYLVFGQHDEINGVVNTALVFYCAGSCIVAALVALFAVVLPWWFAIPAEFVTESRVVVVLVGTYYTIALPLSVFSAVVSSTQRYVPMNMIRLSAHLARAGGIVVSLLFGWGLVGLAVANLIGRLLEQVAIMILARQLCPTLELGLRFARYRTFRDMLGYSLNTFLWSAGNTIITRIDIVLIGLLFTTEQVTQYAIPVMLIHVLYLIAVSLASVTKTATSDLHAQREDDRIRAMLCTASKLVMVVVFPAVAVLGVMGSWIIETWVGPAFVNMANILNVLLIPQPFVLGQMVAFYVLVGIGRHRAFGYLTLATAAANLGLSLWLVVVWGWGLWGIAWGTAVPLAVVSGCIMPVMTSKGVEISFFRYVKEAYFLPAVAVLPFLGYLVLFKYYWYPPDILMFCIGILPGLALYTSLSWFVALGRRDRERLTVLLSRRPTQA